MNLNQATRFILRSEAQAKALWTHLRAWPEQAKAGRAFEVYVAIWRPIRSLKQNKLLHKVLTFVSEQASWAGRKWDPEGWKRIFLAGSYGQTLGPNPLNGAGIVAMNNQRSSVLARSGEDSMTDFLDSIMAWSVDNGVCLDDLDDGPRLWTPAPLAAPQDHLGHYGNRALLDLAHRVQECQLKLPGVCRGFSPHGCEPAHANSSTYGKGAGRKAHDCYHAAACHPCHAELDQGRIFTRGERLDYWRQGFERTLLLYFRQGWLKVAA